MNSIWKLLSGKCVALLVGLAMAVAIFPVFPAAALTHDSYLWVYEDYEINDIEQRITSQDITLNNASVKWVPNGAGGTKGAVNVISSGNYGYMRHKLNMVKGQKYKLSAWIKLNNMALKKNEAHFILYFPAVSDGAPLFTDINISNAGLSADEWIRIEKIYTHDGMGKRIGASAREDVLPEGTIEIRLGDGVVANSTETGKFDFLVDDLIAEPIIEGPETVTEPDVSEDGTNIISDGSFDREFDESKWVLDKGLTVTYQKDGAAGTDGCILLDNAGTSYGAMKKALPDFPVNRAYKVSFYAKAKDGVAESDGSVTDTSGKRIQLIVDNASGLTHTGVTKWNYVRFDEKLTTEWQKYETIYYKSAVTYESAKSVNSFIYPRVGTEDLKTEGLEKVHYYLDEFKMEELPVPYNGNFSDSLTTGWKTANITAELSDDIPAESESVRSVHIKTTGNYGNLSQVLPIEKGKSYEISFWAKGVNWEGKADDSSTVPFSVILDRNAGKSFEGEWAFNGPAYQTITQEGDASLILTEQWRKYTIPYSADFSSTHDCTPNMYWRVGASGATGNGAEYYLADVVLTEITDESEKPEEPEKPEETFDKPLAKNLEIEGEPVEGETLRIRYTYEGPDLEGYSLVRILKAVDAQKGDWVTVRTGFALHESFEDYVIDPICVNQPMKIEVFAIDMYGVPGPISGLEIGSAKSGLVVQPSFPLGWSDSGVSGKVHMENNRKGGEKKSMLVILSLYDANNMMCAQTEKSIELVSGDKKDVTVQLLPTEKACKARLFVWEGSDSLNTSMTAYTDVIELRTK